MYPFPLDPVVDSRATDACDPYRPVNRNKMRLSLAVFTEKARYVLHNQLLLVMLSDNRLASIRRQNLQRLQKLNNAVLLKRAERLKLCE